MNTPLNLKTEEINKDVPNVEDVNKPPQSIEEKEVEISQAMEVLDIGLAMIQSTSSDTSHQFIVEMISILRKKLPTVEAKVRQDEWKKHIQTCQCGKCVNYKRINQLSQEEK